MHENKQDIKRGEQAIQLMAKSEKAKSEETAKLSNLDMHDVVADQCKGNPQFIQNELENAYMQKRMWEGESKLKK